MLFVICAIGINRKRAPKTNTDTYEYERIARTNLFAQYVIEYETDNNWMKRNMECCSWRNNFSDKKRTKTKRQWKWFTFNIQPPVLLVNMSSAGPWEKPSHSIHFTPKFHTHTHTLTTCSLGRKIQSAFGHVCEASRNDIFAIGIDCICINFPISPIDMNVKFSLAQNAESIAMSQHLNNNRSNWTRLK